MAVRRELKLHSLKWCSGGGSIRVPAVEDGDGTLQSRALVSAFTRG